MWVVWICKVWFSFCSGSESLPLRLQQRDPPVARAHITFLPFSTGTQVIWVVVPRQAGQIDYTGEEQQNASKCGQNRVGADQSSENREVSAGVRPETGG